MSDPQSAFSPTDSQRFAEEARKAAEPRLLDEVLRETLVLTGDRESDPAVRQRLKGVAMSFAPNEPLSVEVLSRLTLPIIEKMLPRLTQPDSLSWLSRHMGELLFENPDIRSRLETFWIKLQRSVR